jgi:hypothetical protein
MAGPYGFVNDAANYISSVPNKVISLFKSDDAPGDYSSRKASLARQQKLADALAQMGAQEQTVYSAGGIIAPVSPMAALARGLTSFGGSYLSGKAAADEAALEKAEREAAREGMKSFYELPEKRGLVTSEVEGTKPYQATFQAPTLPGMPAPDAVTAELQMPVGPQTEVGMIPGGPRSRAEQVRMANEFALGDNRILAKLAPALLAQTKPEFEGIGARGTMDTNPDSPTYGTVIGAPTEENEAPKVAGGLQWTGTEWKPIPGYTEQQAAIAAARRPYVIDGRRDFSVKTGLRKEFNLLPDVKAFNDVASSYDVISDIANRKQPSPQDDLSLIYSYVKMLDPESVVREGEFATAENSASVPDRIRNAYNKVIEGTRLNSDQRRQYSNAAKGIYESRSRRYNDLVSEYSDYARDAGLDPKEVFRARGKAGPAPATEPSSPASGGWVTMPNGTRVREQR